MTEAFLHLFITLFIIIDPLGFIPYFLGLTRNFSRKEKIAIISKAILVAFFTLTTFTIFGQHLLKYLHLNTFSFQIAGGILLFLIAIEMIMGYPKSKFEKEKESIAIVPLAIPLLAGPGAIATVIIYTAQSTDFILSRLIMTGIVFLTLFTSWLILINAEHLFGLLKKEGTIVLTKIMGLILMALAVEMIFVGVKAML